MINLSQRNKVQPIIDSSIESDQEKNNIDKVSTPGNQQDGNTAILKSDSDRADS